MTSPKGGKSAVLSLRIRGVDLPGARFDCADGQAGTVHVGVQRGREVVGVVPGNAAEARWDVEVGIVAAPDGGIDFRGPYVHGKRGERFLYLSWGRIGTDGAFAMFRRAKLHLATIADEQLQGALQRGATLEARLRLTDGRGGPICASVRPPALQWRALTS